MDFSLNQGQSAHSQSNGYKREHNFLTQFHRPFIIAGNSQLRSFMMSGRSAHPGAMSDVKTCADGTDNAAKSFQHLADR